MKNQNPGKKKTIKNLDCELRASQERYSPAGLFLHLAGWLAVLLIMTVCISTISSAETGTASFYGNGEKLNKHTANGEVFNPNDLTCATYEYAFNTKLRVTNLQNNKEVIVRVNDRGPNKRLNRIIDLSKRAFEEIADLRKGLIKVRVEEL